jgi:hypothetical protein
VIRRFDVTRPPVPEFIDLASGKEVVSKRPWWCQDPTCTPDCADVGAQIGSFEDHPEYSGFCSGQTTEPMINDRHGQHHVNDGHVCFRSAMRGVVMLNVNEGDLHILAKVALRSLRARGQEEFNLRWYVGGEDK